MQTSLRPVRHNLAKTIFPTCLFFVAVVLIIIYSFNKKCILFSSGTADERKNSWSNMSATTMSNDRHLRGRSKVNL